MDVIALRCNVLQCRLTQSDDRSEMTQDTDQTPAPYNPMIRDMPADMLPRERLLKLGANALSTNELIAILLRTGVKGENVITLSTKLLARVGGLSGLPEASVSDMSDIHGISAVKACQVLAAIELGQAHGQRQPRTPTDDRIRRTT